MVSDGFCCAGYLREPLEGHQLTQCAAPPPLPEGRSQPAHFCSAAGGWFPHILHTMLIEELVVSAQDTR